MLQLYKNIKKYRQLYGWTQQELAEKAGYTDRSSISKIENGAIDLSQSAIIKFANIFGIEPGVLMGNDGTTDALTSAERRLLEYYRKLSDAEGGRLLGYAERLVEESQKDTSKKME